MKKAKLTAGTAATFLIVGTTAFQAFAADPATALGMPEGTAVIGSQAYSLTYANDSKNQDQITNLILNSNNQVYVKDFSGSWINNAGGASIDKSIIPAVTYTDDAGKVTQYAKGDVLVQNGTLSVNSISAITKTEVKVNFNEAVDAVSTSNFTVDGGATVTNAALSQDRTSVTLDLSGVDWSKNYNVTATNILVGGVKQADATSSFKSLDVTEAYDLKISAANTQIEASTGDNTVLTFQLLNKTTGNVDTNANNVVLALSSTYGTLANTKVTVQNGEAKVLLTGEYSTSELVAKIDAQITDASGDYTGLIGKVTGTLNVPFVPAGNQGTDVQSAPVLVQAGASEADRVILYFNKPVSVDTFAQKDSTTGKYLVDANGDAISTGAGVNGNGTHVVISNNSNFSSPATIRGYKAVAGNPNAIEVVLDKSTPLTDNSTVYAKANITSSGNSQSTNFILTDSRRPEAVSVGVTGLKTINVNYSESVVSPSTSQVVVDGGVYGVASVTAGDFDQVTGTDTRNVVTINTNDYMTAGTHSVQIAGLSDYAGLTDPNNICTTQTLSFNVAANDLVPSATVTAESPEQYRVKFNTAVAYKVPGTSTVISDLSTVPSLFNLVRYNATDSKYEALSGDAQTQGLKVERVSDSEYVVEVTNDWTNVYNTALTNKNYYNDKYELSIAKGTTTDANKNITDGIINPANGKAAQADIALDLNYAGSPMNANDTVSPVISSIQRIATTNNFDVVMSKPVKIAGFDLAGDTASQQQGTTIPKTIVEFQGTDKSGNTVTLPGTIYGYDSTTDNDETFGVTLTGIQGLVDSGYGTNWTLIVRSISDDVGNTAATLTQNFTVAKSATVASSFRVVDADNDKTDGVDGIKTKLNSTNPDQIFVTFTEPVQYVGDVNNAVNVSNYTLNGDPLPKGSSISLGTNADGTVESNTIVITLPDKTLNTAGNNTLVLNKSLQSASGDTLTWEHEFVLSAPVDAANTVTTSVASQLQSVFGLASAPATAYNPNTKVTTVSVPVSNSATTVSSLVTNLKKDSTTLNNLQSTQLVDGTGKVLANLDVNNLAATKQAISDTFKKDASTVTLQDIINKGYKLSLSVDGEKFVVNFANPA